MSKVPRFAARAAICVAAAAALAVLAQCGGGPSLNAQQQRTGQPADGFHVVVSAGAPVPGALVTVYAIGDGSGEVNSLAGDRGVLGTGGPTDDSGQGTVTITASSYVGPIQVVASGSALAYQDPTVSVPPGKSVPTIQIPSSFVLSSYVAEYRAGTSLSVPLTILTTLADHAALAFLRGRHPLHPTPSTLTQALTARDALFVGHVSRASGGWDPSALRSTMPANLTSGATTFAEEVYAALFDVALNQLAHDTAVKAGYDASSSTITAITLAQLLEDDLDADARFDGKGSGGTLLSTTGRTPVALDAQFLRLPLATALDEFITGSSNKTGIARSDLNGAGVYDTITNDGSDLFGGPPAVTTFDTTGPTVVVAATFRVGTNSALAPIGSQQFVGGVITLTVDASDFSGVAAIVATANGSNVAASPVSTTGHFVGSWDTIANGTPDGILTFLVRATDTRGNTSTTPFTVTVDNTKPTISVSQPIASRAYSLSVPFDAAATDTGSGVASLTASGYPGLLDQDAALAHFSGVWTLPVSDGPADGPYSAGTLTACDAVGNCATQSPAVLIDRTPPTVNWSGTPTVAVSADIVSLYVTAADSNGVKRLLGQVGSRPAMLATLQSNGQWLLQLPLAPGPNSISVWAEDGVFDASGPRPNSGQAYPVGNNRLSTSVILDSSPPAVAYNAGFANYRDERGMSIATDGSGRAVVPPVYSYASQAPAIIPSAGAHVYKSATRLFWSVPPSAASLEDPNTGNADNIPVLQFSVPYVAGVDAPISSATYSVDLTCAGCNFATATGALWPSATTSPSTAFFDLPLSANLIPGLASLPGPATLSVTVTVSDSAGNVTTARVISLTFHVIGGPVGIAEDTAYTSANDPKSTYPYKIANGLYSTLFTPSTATFLPENGVRLLRYLVTNPAPYPVALTPPAVASGWAAVETWTGDAGTSLGTINYTVPDKFTCSNAPSCAAPTPVSYGGGSAGSGCGASPPHNQTPATETPTPTAGALFSFGYNQVQGSDSSPAPTTAGGQVIVPPASNGAPGMIALYVARSIALPARNYVLPWTGSSYQYVVEDAWVKTWQGATTCCDYDAEFRTCRAYDAPSTWAGTRFSRSLTAGLDALSGTFQLTTSGMSGSVSIGESTVVPGVINVSRTIPH